MQGNGFQGLQTLPFDVSKVKMSNSNCKQFHMTGDARSPKP